jgi:hypothetical protein
MDFFIFAEVRARVAEEDRKRALKEAEQLEAQARQRAADKEADRVLREKHRARVEARRIRDAEEAERLRFHKAHSKMGTESDDFDDLPLLSKVRTWKAPTVESVTQGMCAKAAKFSVTAAPFGYDLELSE